MFFLSLTHDLDYRLERPMAPSFLNQWFDGAKNTDSATFLAEAVVLLSVGSSDRLAMKPPWREAVRTMCGRSRAERRPDFPTPPSEKRTSAEV